LPDIFECEEVIGEVSQEAARQTGLAAGTPVIAGTADAPAGWMGAGAIEEGDTQMNLGTCGNFGVIHRDTDFLKSMLVCAHAVDCRNLYVTIPTTTTGGQSIRYLRDQFSQLEVDVEKLTGISSYRLMDAQAERVPPGSEGLVILPYLMGERTPIWDANARGVIFGLSLNHGKGHIVRAMMESVAYALYDSFQIIRAAGKKINYPIVLNEGGAASRIWRTIITDVFDVPTAVVENRAGAPYGDAVQAGVATGIFKDYSITREKARYVDMIEPDKANHALYMEYFRVYKNLYAHLKEDFGELAVLRNRGI
jgi:xylulokinase